MLNLVPFSMRNKQLSQIQNSSVYEQLWNMELNEIGSSLEKKRSAQNLTKDFLPEAVPGHQDASEGPPRFPVQPCLISSEHYNYHKTVL